MWQRVHRESFIPAIMRTVDELRKAEQFLYTYPPQRQVCFATPQLSEGRPVLLDGFRRAISHANLIS